MLKMYRKYEISVYDYQAAKPRQATNKPPASLCFAGPASQSSRPVLILLTYFLFALMEIMIMMFTVMMRMTTTTYYSDFTFFFLSWETYNFFTVQEYLVSKSSSRICGFQLNYIRPMKLLKVLQQWLLKTSESK